MFFYLDQSKVIDLKNKSVLINEENKALNESLIEKREQLIKSVSSDDISQLGCYVENPLIGEIPTDDQIDKEFNELLIEL